MVACLVPAVIVYTLTIFTLSNMIYRYNTEQARRSVEFFSSIVNDKVEDTLNHANALLHLTSRHMAEALDSSDNPKKSIDELLHTFLESNPNIYCVWASFAPGIVRHENWHVRSFIHLGGNIREFDLLPLEQLTSPEHAPWHFYPYSTSQPYFDPVEPWDYGLGNGEEYISIVSQPIIWHGVTVGAIGIDILYKDVMRVLDQWHIPKGRVIMLLSNEGDILYSREERDMNKNLSDLGSAPEETSRIIETLATGQQLVQNIKSPITGEDSMIYLKQSEIEDNTHSIFIYLDIPLSRILSSSYSIARYAALISLAGFLLIVVGATLTTRIIIKPLREVTRIADRIANGDLDVNSDEFDTAENHSLEVDSMRASLRKMLEQLHQNHQLKVYALEAEYERKKTEEAFQARTKFFACMSHEIRTPMNAIMGLSDILMSEKLTRKQLKYVKSIKVSSESLLVIIDDILDIAKLETGKLELVNVHFSFKRMLENISSISTYLSKEKQLEFSLEMAEDLPKYLYGDEVRLKQILLNLLGNAIKFTNKGSVRLRAVADGNQLVFEVIDTGIGIREEDRASLFNAFQQVDMYKNRNAKGSGLGLSISKKLVEMMGGEIQVTSVYGLGSTFQVRVPMIVGDSALSEDHRELSDAEGYDTDASVLVVDDNEVNLQVTHGVMRLLGLECDVARSGREALSKLESKKYDLVFMDHMMPEMDGVETTRRIRELGGHYAELPIIALTANALSGVKEELVEAGMNDYLSKPIRKQALRAILIKWLPGKSKRGKNTALKARNRHTDSWLEETKKIPGLDMEAGITSVGGNKDLYQKVLRRTRDSLPALIQNLSGASSAWDWKQWELEISNISSQLLKIGALELAEHGMQLSRALPDGRVSYFKLHLAKFIEDLRRMDASLREVPL